MYINVQVTGMYEYSVHFHLRAVLVLPMSERLLYILESTFYPTDALLAC